MKHRAILTAFLLATPALLAAQSRQLTPSDAGAANSVTITATDGNTSKTKTVAVVPRAACPVAMQAKQGSGAGLVTVRRQPGQPDDPNILNKPGQHIHLILGNVPGAQLGDLEQVARATITARGLSARSRIDRTPAELGSSHSDIRRTFDVAFSRDNDGTVYADLVLPGFTSVQSVRIDKLALKDGSTWALDNMPGCVVTPDPLMLIASQWVYPPAH